MISADDDSLRLWNLAGTSERLVLKGHAGVVSEIAFSQKGKRLVTAGHDRVVARDTATGKQITMTELKGAVEAAARVRTGGWRPADAAGPSICSTADRWPRWGSVSHRLGAVHGLEFSPDGDWLAACGQHGLRKCPGGCRLANPKPHQRLNRRWISTERIAHGCHSAPMAGLSDG